MHVQGQSAAEVLHFDVVKHAAVMPVDVGSLQRVAALGLDPGATTLAAVKDAAGLVAHAGWPAPADAVPGEHQCGFCVEREVHQAAQQADQQLCRAHCVRTWRPPHGLLSSIYIYEMLAHTPLSETGFRRAG